MSFEEKQIAHHTVDEYGVRLHTKVGGYSGSSTRTELAAGIVALCAHGPIHIGSDSKAFVDGANFYIDCMRMGKPHNHNWKLISDGDLWEHFHAALSAKGFLAVRATWVKGHATEQHVRDGVTSQVNRTHNNHADATADFGVDEHTQGILAIARFYVRRRRWLLT